MKGGSALLFVLLMTASSCGIAAQNTVCHSDIVFLVDSSGSISNQSFQEIRDFLRQVIQTLDIGFDKIRMGLAQYNNEPHQEFLLKHHMDKESLQAAVEKMIHRKGGTKTGKALDFLLAQYFTKEGGSRAGEGVPQITVIITDGESSDDAIAAAQRLRQHKVMVFGIGVGETDLKDLPSIVSRPSQHFLLPIKNYQRLEWLRDNFLKKVCTSVETQQQNPLDTDVFFLVDSSIAPRKFSIVKGDLRTIIRDFNVSASGSRVGLAQYGQNVAVEFSLNTLQTEEEVRNRISSFRLRRKPNEPCNLANALEHATNHFFTSEVGGRAQLGIKQLLILAIGDNCRIDDMSNKAINLMIGSAGVDVFLLSEGLALHYIDLPRARAFPFGDDRIRSMSNSVIKTMETITADCKVASVADIVFIVDESGSIGPENFQLVRTFLRSLVSGLDVSPTRVRVAFVMYSDTPSALGYLNTFNDKSEMLQFLKFLPYSGGGTNTGAALNFTRENVFVEKRGSREDIQQVVVVITDGESDDSVTEAARLLRRAGTTIYTVGIGSFQNQTQLIDMASYPPHKHVFNVDSFTKLRPMQKSLQKTMCNDIIQKAITDSSSKTDVKKACDHKDEADFFFLLDDSGSIEHIDFDEMRTFVLEFLRTFRIGPKHVRMGVVKYSDLPTMEFDLTAHSNTKELEEAVKGIRHIGGDTKTGNALMSMEAHFQRAMVSRGHKVQEYLIVMTDGESKDKVKAPAEKLRAQGIIIYAIGVKGANVTELNDITGDPEKTFFVHNFDALKSINNKLISDICSEDACNNLVGDIIFLADSSGSINSPDYKKMKDFMKSIIGKSAIGPNEVHFGVMQYSSDRKLEFRLNQHYSKEGMIKVIDDMQQIGGGTLTGEAITEVSQYFDGTKGGRPHVNQRLVVITDGEATDDVIGPAVALRAKGVLVYTIGVVNANTTQLVEISGSLDRVFNERDFDGLKDLESLVALKLCIERKECKKTEGADIIFLVDTSKSIARVDGALESMKTFMKSAVNQTMVGKNHTRFGLINFSTRHESVFTLKQYESKRDVLDAVDKLTPLLEDTHTGEALAYSIQFFNAEHGGRKELKIPQVMFVITDGAAQDASKLKAPSDQLRDNGVTVFSIGVKEASMDQLRIIAGGDESKIFFVDNFDALETLYKNISSVLCDQIKPACEKDEADLVFLLDQSSSISILDYSIMKNFTTELVKHFQVSEALVHVGLAQFSDDPQHGFYLNEYFNTENVITQIQSMEHHGGNTYIGKALYFMKEYFKASRGSRSGISKNLVLITDGDSHDDVEDAAEHLRALGIEMFAIGIGDVHDLQLLQITGTPEKLFHVQDFSELANIKKDLTRTICRSKIKPSCSIDIAMGFDITQTRGSDDMLISGHAKLQTFLPEIVHYVSSVQGLSCIGPTPVKTKIAFQLVDQQGSALYNTTFESYSTEMVDHFMTQWMKQPTYFNTALLNSFKERFKESGGRVKVLVIFSDGLDEDVMKLEHESELLRQSGVSALLTVALEGARDPTQLQMLEFGRGFGYQIPLTIGMSSIGSTMFKQIDAVSDRECCNVMCKCSGHEGVRGLYGRPGPKGGLGRTGQRGFPGEEGNAGGRGHPGPSGPQGTQGCPGSRGGKGYRGISGHRGENGEDGQNGVDGEQGLAGLGGAQGEQGHAGNPGIPGIRGEVGLKGERGLRGDPGERGVDNTVVGDKGEPGNPGLPGHSGLDGRPGAPGTRGNPGPNGRRGASGEKGPRGANGERGPKGLPGLPGRQGEHGPAGESGPSGRRGASGQKGQQGDTGVKGVQGSSGSYGQPGQDGRNVAGPPGPKGVKGDPGFPGYPGPLGEDGLQGTKGFPGRKGNQGRGGNAGRAGETGVAGDPGHPGHKGPRGPPGGRDMTECELITFIRKNCACSHGRSECPAYATELVFGLDMSEDVTPAAFQRQLNALLYLLEDITIAESNCPTGARVAVVGYSAHTESLIRFQDHGLKRQLIESVRKLSLVKTSKRRDLGAAMRFVGQNVFKRVRGGIRMRKVAVFFSNGQSDTSKVISAVMEYRALNIVPVVVSLRTAPPINRALQLDDSGNSIFTLLLRDPAADLRKVKSCAICYDPCKRSEQCAFIQEVLKPQEADVDLVMVVDSSREVQADEYSGVQQLLGSVVEQLAVSPQPGRTGNQARVAVVQQSGTQAIRPVFALQTYDSPDPMRTQILNMQQQGGSSALGQTLEFCLTQLLLKATQPRKKRMLLTVVGTQTAYEDRARLDYISQKAKCAGVALFVVTVGDRYNRTQVEQLAGAPLNQHLIHVSRLRTGEQDYARRFIRVFINALNKGVNTYPPPSLKQSCSRMKVKQQIFSTHSQRPEPQTEQEAQEQTGLRPQTVQLGAIHTSARGRRPRSVSGAADLKEPRLLAPGPSYYSWDFDGRQVSCTPVWYGGYECRGNMFETLEDCERMCW